jgi:16S rRNA (cytidine1402-2'-O)-methyltransferase
MNPSEPAPGRLYLVPTPIGNIDDLSPRARRTLAEADLIAAEDTRVAGAMLRQLGVGTPCISYHDHNEATRAVELTDRIVAGARIALVTDAGTPGVSDPGYRLVLACIARGVQVVSLPGPSAVTTALAGSGLPPDAFTFIGFLPRKEGGRRAILEQLRSHPFTVICFEAPHRLLAALGDVDAVLGNRRVAVGWNLSKPNERFLRGSARELAAEVTAWDHVHGEITLVIEGRPADPARNLPAEAERAIDVMMAHGVELRVVRDCVSDLFGLSRRTVYQALLARKPPPTP